MIRRLRLTTDDDILDVATLASARLATAAPDLRIDTTGPYSPKAAGSRYVVLTRRGKRSRVVDVCRRGVASKEDLAAKLARATLRAWNVHTYTPETPDA